MNQYETRKLSRERVANILLEHERKQGRDPSFDSCQRRINDRADYLDTKKEIDRGKKQ